MHYFLGDPGPENRGAEATHVSFVDRDNLTPREQRFLDLLETHKKVLEADNINFLLTGYSVRFDRRISEISLNNFIADGPPLIVDNPPSPGKIENAQTFQPDPKII